MAQMPGMQRGSDGALKSTYYRLFVAYVVALVSAGVATVAVTLVAHDLAGADAGSVLGTALSIKAFAFVTLAPVIGALAQTFPRRGLIVLLAFVCAAIALLFPLVTKIWQLYVLVFLFYAAAAAFQPAYQAIVPDLLPDEDDYTRSQTRSRLAGEVETAASPLLAAGLLTVISGNGLFLATAIGFVAAASLIIPVELPSLSAGPAKSLRERIACGFRIYFSAPKLRALGWLTFSVSSAVAMVIVNTVVLVQSQFALRDEWTAIALGAFGAGSMAGALLVPWLLPIYGQRRCMLSGAAMASAGLLLGAINPTYAALLAIWFMIGAGTSLAMTPAGLLLKQSCVAEDRASLFTAHFTVTNACLLVTCSLAGWMGSALGLSMAFSAMSLLAAASVGCAVRVWPRRND